VQDGEGDDHQQQGRAGPEPDPRTPTLRVDQRLVEDKLVVDEPIRLVGRLTLVSPCPIVVHVPELSFRR
jgi:hypothetical protein